MNRRLTLPSLLLFSFMQMSACFATDKAIAVPIFFISDRRPPGLHMGDPGRDQNTAVQQIWTGNLLVRINVPEEIETTTLKDLCDTNIPAEYGKQSIKNNLSLQLKQFSQSVAMNIGAGGGTETPFNSVVSLLPPFKELQRRLELLKSGQVVVFVHGCCLTPKATYQQAAEMSAWLKLPVISFDWATPGLLDAPPAPEVNAYRRSERVLEISQSNFALFMDWLLKSFPNKHVILVGHSMGNRIIKEYLLQLCDRDVRSRLDEVHLVRADLSLTAFLLQQGKICSNTKRLYAYTSDNDFWLARSKDLSGGAPRLGEPYKLLELAERQGMTVDWPANRFYIDISALNLNLKWTPLFGPLIKQRRR